VQHQEDSVGLAVAPHHTVESLPDLDFKISEYRDRLFAIAGAPSVVTPHSFSPITCLNLHDVGSWRNILSDEMFHLYKYIESKTNLIKWAKTFVIVKLRPTILKHNEEKYT